MIYRIDCDRWGRFFSVPCSVVDEYIKLSDGEFVKILLCILSSNSCVVDTGALAVQAGVSSQIAEDAVVYWAGLGVISAANENGTEIKKMPEKPVVSASVVVNSEPKSKPVKENPVSSIEAINPAKSSQANKTSVKYTPRELSEIAEKNEEIKMLVNDIQKILCRTINMTEMAGIINLYEYYGFSAASILMISEYCYQLGKDRFAYIETVAKNWFERGIVDYLDVENEIIKQSEERSFQNKAAKVLGIEGKLTKKQIEFIDKWRQMGYTLEMIEIAYEKCMNNKNKLSLSYVDGIFKNWSGKSIITPEQVAAEDAKFLNSSSSKKKFNPKTENKNTSYDLSDWEQLAMNNDPNRRRGNN